MIPAFTGFILSVVAMTAFLLSGCQSEAEKQKEAQQDAKHAFLEKFGFDDKVPEKLLGRWVDTQDPRFSFVIEAKGDSVIKKHYFTAGLRAFEECGGCGSISGMYYDAKHDAVYTPDLFPNRKFGFIENDTTRWTGEIFRFQVSGDKLTFYALDRDFKQHPKAPVLVYTRKPQ